METSMFGGEENISFWKNLILAVIFFTITPVTLAISLYSIYSFKGSAQAKTNLTQGNLISSPQSGVRVYASLPNKLPSIEASVGSADARPEIIKQYAEYYNSPLTQYAGLIVQVADKYSLDYRLIPAIAQQESSLCKIIPPDSYNCWGWGIHSQGSLGFDSYEQAIETVSKGLREEYLNKGYSTIEEIMSKYTPLSNGSWAYGVSQFMEAMQ